MNIFSKLSSSVCLLISVATVASAATINIDTFSEAFTPATGSGDADWSGVNFFENVIGAAGTYTWTDNDSGSNIFGDTRTVAFGPISVEGGGTASISRDASKQAFIYQGGPTSRANTAFSYTDSSGVDMSADTNWAFDIIAMDEPARNSIIASITLTNGTDTTSTAIFFTNATLGYNSIDLDTVDDFTGYGTSWSGSDWDNIKTNVTGITITYIVPNNDEDFEIASKFFSEIDYGGLTQVPEPSSLFLLGTIFTGYLLKSRRRR